MFPISYRDLALMLLGRGVSVAPMVKSAKGCHSLCDPRAGTPVAPDEQ
jgi:hypothetical protein